MKDAKKGYVDTGADVGELTKKQNELRTAINENNRTLRNQIKEVNAADGSINQLRAQLNLLNQTYDDLNANDRNGIVGKEMLAGIEALSTSLKELEGETGRFQRDVGNYKNGFDNAFSEFKSGNIQGGIDEAKVAMNGLVASARAFIASPLGIAVAVLAGIGLAAKEVWDYNEGLQESIKLTKQLTGLTGSASDDVRQRAQAMTNAFGGEFKTNLQAAQKLVVNFGISYDQAFEEIERGLAKGGMANEEFFSSINEYPVFFKNAGYSAREFIDIINEGFTQGVYNDKLIDAIKEADISLREQTTSTRDALVNAFGASFTDEILKRIRTGRTSVKDALTEIAQQAEKTALTEQQLGQLTADVFRGAGEDVGGAAKMFDIMRESANSINEPLTEAEQKIQDLSEAHNELQVAMDEALKVDGVINLQQSLEILWVKVQTVFFQILKPIRETYEWFWKISGRSESLSSIWGNLQRIGVAINNVIEHLQTTFGRLADKLGLGNEEVNGFYRAISFLFDPIALLEVALNVIVELVEFAADSFERTTIFAEAFGRTIGQISRDIRNLDFSSLSKIGDILSDNVNNIKAENAEYEYNQKLLKQKNFLLETFHTAEEAMAAERMRREKEEQDAIIQRKKAEEEAAKKRDELAKKYAADQKKRLEEQKRLAEERFREEVALNQSLLDNFKLTQDGKLKFDESFTLNSLLAQKQYFRDLYDLQLKNAAHEAKLDFEAVKRKYDNGEVLSSNELKLINYSIQLENEKSSSIQKIDDDLAKWKDDNSKKGLENQKKILAIDFAYFLTTSEDKKATEESYFNALNNLMLSHYQKTTGLNEKEVEEKYLRHETLTEAESEYLKLIFEMRQEARDTEKEAKDNDLKSDLDRMSLSLEYLGESFGAEAEMREIFEAYKAFLKAKDIGDTAAAEQSKLNIIAATAGAAVAILGKYTVFGKAAAIVEATINTYTAATAAIGAFSGIPVVGPALGIAAAATIVGIGIANVAKIISAKPPTPPQFEHGVVNSSYEGIAIKDEAGPEIQLDKKGNIKDWGTGYGAKKFNIKKGDTILPNPISDRIKKVMDYNPMPDLMMSLDLNSLNKRDYDFARLERKLDKLDRIERAISDKPNYVRDGDNLIEVSGKNGSSHQRIIPKATAVVRTQNGLFG